MLVHEARQVIDDLEMRFEAGFRRFLRIELEVVHAADAVEDVKAQPRIIPQELANVEKVSRLNDDKGIDGFEILGLDLGTELDFENVCDFRSRHCRLALLALSCRSEGACT